MSELVIIRGGGDLATGSIQKLHRTGFNVLVLETEKPLCVRRSVSCAQAIIQGEIEIEDIRAKKVDKLEDIKKAWKDRIVPIVVDPLGKYIDILKPVAVVDCIIAKKNLGTNIDMAPITIAVGPGFEAGKEVDIVVESERGHNLARLIFEGRAAENTGEPGNIGGYTVERLLRAPQAGTVAVVRDIGSSVKAEEIVAYVDESPVKAQISGMVRGMINNGTVVSQGLKIGDVDPRNELKSTKTISDKARAIAGGVLEGIFIMKYRKNLEFNM